LLFSCLGDGSLRSAELLGIGEDLHSKNVDVRRGAALQIQVAAKAEQIALLPAMIEVLEKEKDGQVRLAVLDALKALGADAKPAGPALLQTVRTDVGGGGEEARHQDYRAAIALAAIGKAAVRGLTDLLTDKKAPVRINAVMALGRIGGDAESAIPELI